MSTNPRKPAAANLAAEENASQFRVQTIFIAMRCWWKIAAPLGIVLAIGAAAGMYYFSKPQYTAATWLIIRDRPQTLLQQQALEDPRKFVENQLELLRSPPVIDPVASIPAVVNTPEIMRFGRDPAQALRKLLKIRSLGRSDYFVIEFTSIDRDKAALIVNEIAKAYLELQRSTHSKVQSVTLELLKKEQASQQALVERYRDNVRNLTKQLTGSEAFPIGPNQNLLEIRNTTSELQAKLVAAEVDHVLLKAQAGAEQGIVADDAAAAPTVEINRQVESSEPVLSLRAKIQAAKDRAREHEQATADVEQSPAYQRLQSDLLADEAKLEQLRGELREQVKKHLETTTRAHRESFLADLQQRAANAEFTAKILREKIDQENQGRQAEKGESLELEFVRADYVRASTVYAAIADRILQMQMEQRAPSQVEQFEVARPPASPDGDQPYKKMAIVAFCALFVPLGCAVALEHLYRRVSNRDQLENVGGITVVGEVTSLPRRARRKAAAATPNRELQLFEESIDGLRTYLSLVQSLQGMQVLAVTSAVSREGKTSLATQLAISLASATGERTLLIDGDTRSPDIHRAFDIDRGPGLVDVLQGTIFPEEAIDTTYSDHLHVLTAGRLDASPHRLITMNEFEALLTKLKGSYRHIVIDTPPLLPASEALLLARVADAAVLCVRRDFSRIDQTVEAYRRLCAAGVKVAGAVLNGIPARSYVYRYGAYYRNLRDVDDSLPVDVAT